MAHRDGRDREGRPIVLASAACECAVAPLREAFLASGLTAGDVARALGWTRTDHGYRVADSGRVRRYLGLAAQNMGRGYRGKRQRCSYEVALRLAGAIGVDPVDVGL